MSEQETRGANEAIDFNDELIFIVKLFLSFQLRIAKVKFLVQCQEIST